MNFAVSGDVVLIGKHTLLFDGRASEEPVEGTDTDTTPGARGHDGARHEAAARLLAKIDAEARAKKAAAGRRRAAAGTGTVRQAVKPAAAPPAPPPRIGMLRVLSGRADQADATSG